MKNEKLPILENWRDETSGRFLTKHGEAYLKTTVEYRTWISLRNRCLSPANKQYQNYGARGIKVCKRWDSYTNFLSDMGRRPSPNHSIDRIDNNGDYEPSNCKWATKKEQASNRRNSHWIIVDNKKILLTDLARSLKIRHTTLNERIKKGWSIKRILSTPVKRSLYAFNLKAGSRVYKNKTPIEVADILGVSCAMVYLLRKKQEKYYKGFEIEYVETRKRYYDTDTP
jgi:hypothetical protein